MRTKQQEVARYRWLSPAEAGERIGGVSRDHVIRLLKEGELRARNVALASSKRPDYRIDPDSVDEFNRRRIVSPEDVAE